MLTKGIVLIVVLTCPTSALAQSTPSSPPASAPAQSSVDAKSDQSRAPRPAAKDKQPAKPAQSPPAAPDKATAVRGVTVTGTRSDYQSSIDRRSYTMGKDLQSTTGSLGDALRNIPAVQVDVQGNISLRGDSNVTILVDGKPSGMFNGQNRADALQQLPADRYERVEVMTNPSAAFKPDGSGGIINLITKKGTGAASTGSVRVNMGNEGRYNGGISGSYNSKKLSLSGSFGFRHDRMSSDNRSTQQVLDSNTGTFANTEDTYHLNNHGTSGYAQGSVDYDLDDRTRLSADASHFEVTFGSQLTGTYRANGGSGLLGQGYNSIGAYPGHWSGSSASGTYLRKFSGQEHEFSLRLSYDESHGHYASRNLLDYLDPSVTNFYEDLFARRSEQDTELKAEYKGPLPGDAKLVTGYQLTVQSNTLDNQGGLGADPADVQFQPGLTNQFQVDQYVHALYVTYQKPFGDFTVMPGLRLEDVFLDTDLKTTGQTDHWSYFRAYPTLHLSYKLSDTQKLTASYSRRVQRPGGDLLDPVRVYQGPLSYSQGNPRLEPQITDSYEAGWEYRHRATYFQGTLFYRETSNAFTQVVTPLPGGALLTTQANLGQSRNGGLELVANGPITKTLTYNISGDVFWNQIDASNLGYTGTRSGYSLYGRGTINWQMTKKDFLQLNLNGAGKQLTAQGYRGPHYMLNLGYRHTFNDKWSGVITVQDPFAGSRSSTVIDTPTLKQRLETHTHIRSIYVGLRYAFGGASKPKPETFDFGGGSAPGGGPH